MTRSVDEERIDKASSAEKAHACDAGVQRRATRASFCRRGGALKTWRNSTSRSRPSTCSASARLQTAVSSGKTKRGTGLLSQWRQARRLKHRWEKQEGSPGGHSSRLTPCLPRARGRHRPPSTGAALEPKWLRRLSLSLSLFLALLIP